MTVLFNLLLLIGVYILGYKSAVHKQMKHPIIWGVVGAFFWPVAIWVWLGARHSAMRQVAVVGGVALATIAGIMVLESAPFSSLSCSNKAVKDNLIVQAMGGAAKNLRVEDVITMGSRGNGIICSAHIRGDGGTMALAVRYALYTGDDGKVRVTVEKSQFDFGG